MLDDDDDMVTGPHFDIFRADGPGSLHAGNWCFVQYDGRKTIKVSCPTCGTSANLAGTHEVDELGNVSPSLICPDECGFHEWVILEGWE